MWVEMVVYVKNSIWPVLWVYSLDPILLEGTISGRCSRMCRLVAHFRIRRRRRPLQVPCTVREPVPTVHTAESWVLWGPGLHDGEIREKAPLLK